MTPELSEYQIQTEEVAMYLYKVLGVSKDATAEDIKKTYRELAFKLHPDRNPGDRKIEARFKRIAEAYAVLSDPAKRKHFDETGEMMPSESKVMVETIQVITMLLQQVLAKLSPHDGSLRREDVITLMRQHLNASVSNMRKGLANLEGVRAGFLMVADRFIAEDGTENVLRHIAVEQARMIEHQIKAQQNEINKTAAVDAYLKKFRYSVDAPTAVYGWLSYKVQQT